MKTKTKRFLSVLVAALLSVWIFPAGVLAADAVLPDGFRMDGSQAGLLRGRIL